MNRVPHIPFILLVLMATALGQQPTPEETLALEWLNRFRLDPAGESRLIHEEARPTNSGDVDWKMFLEETAVLEAVPPVFFDANLIAACRSHAKYVVTNSEWGHVETEGRPGFTGVHGSDRARHHGYGGDGAWECAGANPRSPREAVADNVVDAGKGPGGMQSRRGHRATLMKRSFRDVGIGFAPFHGGRLSSVMLFGVRSSSERRLVGGVAFDDRDGDAFYDIGEGLRGVHVTVAGYTALGWRSGAYTLPIGNVREAAEVVATFGTLTLRGRIGAGADNAKVDFRFPVRERLDVLRRTLEDEKATPASVRDAVLEIDLLGGDVGDRREIVEAWVGTKASIVEAMGRGDAATMRRLIAAGKRDYRGSPVASWFGDVARVAKFEREASRRTPMKDAKFERTLRVLRAEITWPDLHARLSALERGRSE